MCEELNKEIERGNAAIVNLAQHLIAMGATIVERTIAVDGCIITIKGEVKARNPR